MYDSKNQIFAFFKGQYQIFGEKTFLDWKKTKQEINDEIQTLMNLNFQVINKACMIPKVNFLLFSKVNTKLNKIKPRSYQ